MLNIELPPDLDLSGLTNAEIVARLEAGMAEFERRSACSSRRAAVIIPTEPETLSDLERLAVIHQMSLPDYLSALLRQTVRQWGTYLNSELGRG